MSGNSRLEHAHGTNSGRIAGLESEIHLIPSLYLIVQIRRAPEASGKNYVRHLGVRKRSFDGQKSIVDKGKDLIELLIEYVLQDFSVNRHSGIGDPSFGKCVRACEPFDIQMELFDDRVGERVLYRLESTGQHLVGEECDVSFEVILD